MALTCLLAVAQDVRLHVLDVYPCDQAVRKLVDVIERAFRDLGAVGSVDLLVDTDHALVRPKVR